MVITHLCKEVRQPINVDKKRSFAISFARQIMNHRCLTNTKSNGLKINCSFIFVTWNKPEILGLVRCECGKRGTWVIHARRAYILRRGKYWFCSEDTAMICHRCCISWRLTCIQRQRCLPRAKACDYGGCFVCVASRVYRGIMQFL